MTVTQKIFPDVVLVDKSLGIVQAWREAFAGCDNVEIVHGSILDDVTCEAIVSPGNSFGFMDGGLDLAISQRLGWVIQERLQAVIRERHHGELVVGCAQEIRTDCDRPAYVIAAPTMRVPMKLPPATPNAYLAMRAVLKYLKYGALIGKEGYVIPGMKFMNSVAIPGLGTGVGGMPSDDCARQMRMAYDQIVLGEPAFPESWKEAQDQHQRIVFGAVIAADLQER